uniref:Uncharacterized protein n=1 Tax=Caenorhabditis japonica TaxID=281687 RepID=A0A8R1ECS0_CAEJA
MEGVYIGRLHSKRVGATSEKREQLAPPLSYRTIPSSNGKNGKAAARKDMTFNMSLFDGRVVRIGMATQVVDWKLFA